LGGRRRELPRSRPLPETELLEASVHPKIVSEALGHSSVSFTMDTYQHLMSTIQDAATRAIEEAIGGTLAAGLEDG
jgi:integrase